MRGEAPGTAARRWARAGGRRASEQRELSVDDGLPKRVPRKWSFVLLVSGRSPRQDGFPWRAPSSRSEAAARGARGVFR